MQVFRDLGVEGDVIEKATPQHLMGDTVFCTSLAGEELARLHTWGTHPARLADYTLASPTTPVDIPQTLLEPILVNHAAARGAKFRFNTEYLSLEQDDDGVTATVLDRISGEETTLRARYLIGADGGRSKVASDIGLPMEGQMDVAGSMNIVLEADLSRYVAHRPSILYWVLQPGSRIGGIGMGLVRTVRPWDEWLLIWGYDISGPPPEMNDEKAISIARSLIGDETIPIRIKSYSLWGNNKMYATRYADRARLLHGRRRPPPPALERPRLEHVRPGRVQPGLEARARPPRARPARRCSTATTTSAPRSASRSCCARTSRSRSSGRSSRRSGCSRRPIPEQMQANMDGRKDDTPEAREKRAGFRQAIELKNYEFNCHGVELGQRYRSSAVVPDGTAGARADPRPRALLPPDELAGRAAAALLALTARRDGAREHARPRRQGTLHDPHRDRRRGVGARGRGGVRRDGRRDRVRHDRAGPRARGRLLRVGAPRPRSRRAAALLVRPDTFVAWRRTTAVADCVGELRAAMRGILGPT